MKTFVQIIILCVISMATTYAWGQIHVVYNPATHKLTAFDNLAGFGRSTDCQPGQVCSLAFQYQSKKEHFAPYMPEHVVHYHKLVAGSDNDFGFIFDLQRGDGKPYRTCIVLIGIDGRELAPQCWPYHQ